MRASNALLAFYFSTHLDSIVLLSCFVLNTEAQKLSHYLQWQCNANMLVHFAIVYDELIIMTNSEFKGLRHSQDYILLVIDAVSVACPPFTGERERQHWSHNGLHGVRETKRNYYPGDYSVLWKRVHWSLLLYWREC